MIFISKRIRKQDRIHMAREQATRPIKDLKQEMRFIRYLEQRDKRVYIFYCITRIGAFRCSEVLEMTAGDLKQALKKHKFEINERKTRYDRCVPIVGTRTMKILEAYIKDMYDKDVLFPSRNGNNQPLSYKQMHRLLSGYGKDCGLERVGTHTGRKTAGYHFYMNNGKNIRELMRFLGHANEAESYSYADVWEESQEERVRMTSNPLEEADYYSAYYDAI